MKIDVITLFPEMFASPLNSSLLKKAQDKGVFTFKAHQLRDWAIDKHGTVDSPPFGGGAGMVLRVEPFDNALRQLDPNHTAHRILMTPQGAPFKQARARELSAKRKHLIFLCGHYEGFDERIREHFVTMEISIGDYVLSGGELAAAIVVDAVGRLLPGVLNDETSALFDSFQDDLLAPPVYTRPADFRGWKVPGELLSGDPKIVDTWRYEKAMERTRTRRPDLLDE